MSPAPGTPQPLVWEDAILDPALWQGIDHLSFATDIPGYDAVVTVHLARPVDGIAAEQVVLEGGESLTGLDHEVEIADGASSFLIRFPTRGDYSAYVVRLLSGGADPLHPFFDRAAFSFYVDCPAGDCRPLTVVPERPPRPRPAIDHATRDYRGFVALLGDWIAATNPHWGDLSPASFERMLLEVLAHHADQLAYFQDRVANEAFLDTARERHALRQHGVLLGYALDEGAAARTVLAFDVAAPGVLPAGVAVDVTGAQGEVALVYVTETAVRLEPAHNAGSLAPAAWPGAAGARLAAGATSMLLFGHGLGLAAGQRLAFAQAGFAQVVTLTDVEEDALAGWVADPSDPPSTAAADVTRIVWAEPLTTAVSPWSGAAPFVLRGNLVAAIHGEPRRAQSRPGGAADGALDMPLDRRSAIVVPRMLDDGSVTWLLRALALPEAPVLFETDVDGDARPALTVVIDGEPWTREPHLWASRAYDRHYVAEADAEGRIWLQFGDDVHGRAVPVGRIDAVTYEPAVEIDARYRLGVAAAGNCAPGTLDRVRPPEPGSAARDALAALGVTAVTNVVAGRGGRAPESGDAARFAIPDSLRHGPLRRAVTLADYAEVATSVPGVARAAAVALGGLFNTVAILVDPRGGAELTPELSDAVWRRVDDLRMAGREHVVRPPDYVPVEVELAVCAEPGVPRHRVRDRVLAALRPGEADRPGWFHPDRLSFGEDLVLGDLLAFVHGLPGVRSVKAFAFRRLRDASLVRVVDRIAVGATEVARLDGDDNRPERGVLAVRMVGLDLVDESAFDLGGPATETGP